MCFGSADSVSMQRALALPLLFAFSACSLLFPAEVDADREAGAEIDDAQTGSDTATKRAGEGDGGEGEVGEGEGEGEVIDVGEGDSEAADDGGDGVFALCDGVLVDTTRDEANCGECGNACAVAGSASCTVDEVCRAFTLSDEDGVAHTDGGCFCEAPPPELAGCEEREMLCLGVCIDPGSDVENCGECSNACVASPDCASPRCVDGGCQCEPPPTSVAP